MTWYRLCHLAHTVPLVAVESGAVPLLELDLKALQEIVREIFHSYKECALVERYPAMLRELSRAIDDERWGWVLAGEEALFHMVVAEDYKVAQKILAIYNWRIVDIAEFLEIYLDAFSEKLLHVECIEIATKIVELTACASSRFHYQFVIACQHFLLNDHDRAVVLGRAAICEYEKVPVSKRTAHGRISLARAYMHLGQGADDFGELRTAIDLFMAEVAVDGYKDITLAQIWCDVGECHFFLGEFYMAEKFYSRSVGVCDNPLARIYLAKIQLRLGRHDRVSSILNEVDLKNATPGNKFDYAIVRCELALKTKKSGDVDLALELIKQISTDDPYFKDVVRELIVGLYDLPISKDSSFLASALKKFNKYIILAPNFSGVGVNFNAMIDDLVRRKGGR